jgi:hypothetical protein
MQEHDETDPHWFSRGHCDGYSSVRIHTQSDGTERVFLSVEIGVDPAAAPLAMMDHLVRRVRQETDACLANLAPMARRIANELTNQPRQEPQGDSECES